MGDEMSKRRARSQLQLAVAIAALSLATAARAVELDPAAVVYKTPDQFTWADPTRHAMSAQHEFHRSRRGYWMPAFRGHDTEIEEPSESPL
jgi:hypothetical protein